MHFINSFSSNSLLDYNSYDTIRGFAKRLAGMEKGYVFIYATGFSAIPAEYFTKKLLVLGKKCIYSNGMDSIGVFENNLVDMELLIAVSRSGETNRVADRIKTAKENGIFTVSFTNEKDNRVNELTDRNMMANTFFPNVLLLMELLIYEYHRVLPEPEEDQ